MAPGRAGPRELQREGQSLCPALGCGPSWAIDDHCPRVRQLLTMRHTHWRFQGDRWTRSETCSGVTGPRLPVNSWAACTQMKQGSSCAWSFQVGSRATHLQSVPLAPHPCVRAPRQPVTCSRLYPLPQTPGTRPGAISSAGVQGPVRALTGVAAAVLQPW